MTIAVMGAGAFGTALAIAQAQAGRDTLLWARDPAQVRAIQADGENARYLPGIRFPENLTVTAEIDTVSAADAALVAIPMQKLRAALDAHGKSLSLLPLVLCCKGIELGTRLGPVEVTREVLSDATPALLTGPSFARDIAAGLPTALTLACADEVRGEHLQALLSTPTLRLYRSRDTVGAELGGALKNVIAIACGAAMGAGLGHSARAALMTRGFAEMNRIAVHLGADPRTLVGLSGFGDLVLTCSTDQSRNYALGHALGSGEAFDPRVTVEGADTARAVHDLAGRLGIEMPITASVVALLEHRRKVSQIMADLLTRPLREE